MNDKFRLVLIGAGRIGAQAHLPAALSCEGVDLVAIVDSVPERAAELTRNYGLSIPIFRELEPALALADGAIVATPNDTHYAIAARCLELGVHVLIEKPMTETYAEALRLAELSQAKELTVTVGYVTRHRANIQLLKALLDQDYFGRVVRFAYQYGTMGGWAPLDGYKGGVLAVTGSHFLDRMLWFWRYPHDMQYLDDGAKGPEANCVATFQYTDGIQGSLRCSKTASLPGGFVLDTEVGRVVLVDTDDAEIVVLPKASQRLEYTIRSHDVNRLGRNRNTFVAQIRDFATTCRSGAGFGCVLSEGILSIRLMEELYSRRQLLLPDWYASLGLGRPE